MSGRGNRAGSGAGESLPRPIVTGPIGMPIRDEKTGSVSTHWPPIRISTDACPSHVAARDRVESSGGTLTSSAGSEVPSRSRSARGNSTEYRRSRLKAASVCCRHVRRRSLESSGGSRPTSKRVDTARVGPQTQSGAISAGTNRGSPRFVLAASRALGGQRSVAGTQLPE